MKKISVFFTPTIGQPALECQYTKGPVFYLGNNTENVVDLAEIAFRASNAPDEILTAEEKNIRLLWGDNRSMSVGDIVKIHDADGYFCGALYCASSGWQHISYPEL